MSSLVMHWLKQVALKGEINTLRMKLEIPGPLARIPNWEEKIKTQIQEKEEELRKLES